MTYTLDHKLAEANALFLICEAIRMILIKERDDGVPHSELLKKLIAFYQVTSPDMAEALKGAAAEKQYAHLVGVLDSHILIYLRHDEFVDFTKVREYLKETWPEVDQEFFEKPTTFSYVSIGGQKFAVNPGNPILLEKVDSVPEWPAGVPMEKTGPDWTQKSSPMLQEMLDDSRETGDQVIDRSVDIQAKLYNFWKHTNDGVIGPMDLVWANDFPTFEKWAMENGFKQGMAILRKDMEGGYTPDNCYIAKREVPNRSGHQNIRDL